MADLITKTFNVDTSEVSIDEVRRAIAEQVPKNPFKAIDPTNLKFRSAGVVFSCVVTKTDHGYKAVGNSEATPTFLIASVFCFLTPIFCMITAGESGLFLFIFAFLPYLFRDSHGGVFKKAIERAANEFKPVVSIGKSKSQNVSEEIKGLLDLKNQGTLTEEEFQKAKAKLLAA
jgi:hypothetical protein